MKDIAGQTLRMNSDERRPVGLDFPFDQRNEFFVAGHAAKTYDAEAAELRGEIRFRFFTNGKFGCCSVLFEMIVHFPPWLIAFKTDVAPMLQRTRMKYKGRARKGSRRYSCLAASAFIRFNRMPRLKNFRLAEFNPLPQALASVALSITD